MRFFVAVKADELSESGAMPSPELLKAMNQFNEELVAAGIMLDGNGLQPSSEGFLLVNESDEGNRSNDGTQLRIIDGPFTETKELIAGYWLIQAKNMEEAVAWIKRSPLDLDGQIGRVEIRPVFELDDFPEEETESGWRQNEERLREEWNAGSPTDAQGALQPQPGKLVYMGIVRSTAESEAGATPSEEELATMGDLMEESAAAGILLGGEGLKPSAEGVRITFDNGTRTVVDGPFAETKELVGGYAIMQFDDEEQAREWTIKFAKTSGQQLVEVRKVFRAEDFSEELHQQVPEVFEAEDKMREQLSKRN